MPLASWVLNRQLMVARAAYSLRDQGLDLPPEGGFVGDALLEAGAGQHA